MKVLAISKIQSGEITSWSGLLSSKILCSGRKSDTVARELGIPVVMVERWWLQREDITIQYEKYCSTNRDSELLMAKRQQDRFSQPAATPEEEPHDLKDLDFTPEEVSGKVEVESDEEKEGKRRKRRKVDKSPYKRRKRVELPTVKSVSQENKTRNEGKLKTGGNKVVKGIKVENEERKCEKEGKKVEQKRKKDVEDGETVTDEGDKPIPVVRGSRQRQSAKAPVTSRETKPRTPPAKRVVRNRKRSADVEDEQLNDDREMSISRKSSLKSLSPENEVVKNDDEKINLESEKGAQEVVTKTDSVTLPDPKVVSELYKSVPEDDSTLLDDTKPIINFMERVREDPEPVTPPVVSSPVVAPRLLDWPRLEIPERIGPPLASSSHQAEAGPAPRQLKAVNIKKETLASLEYIEEESCDSNKEAESSADKSVVERYYSSIGSEPSVDHNPLVIKTEREVRERSVSPPVSEYPLVPVETANLTFDLMQPSQIAPAQSRGSRGRVSVERGVMRGRAVPVRGRPGLRGGVVRGPPPTVLGRRGGQPRVRGQPVRGVPLHRGQVMIPRGRGRGGVSPVAYAGRGRGQVIGRGQLAGRGRGQLVHSQGVARVRPRPPAPAPAPLPEKLSQMKGLSLSVVRQKPVSLPQGIRLPSGITLSHPRGIQNQPPPPPPVQPVQPQRAPDTERKQKVSLELTAKQIETLKGLGYL